MKSCSDSPSISDRNGLCGVGKAAPYGGFQRLMPGRRIERPEFMAPQNVWIDEPVIERLDQREVLPAPFLPLCLDGQALLRHAAPRLMSRLVIPR